MYSLNIVARHKFCDRLIKIKKKYKLAIKLCLEVVRSAGLEPATYGLEGCCSIQLSYERKIK